MSELKEYFQPQKPAFASLPFISRPARDEKFIVFMSEHDGFAAFIHQDVRDDIFHEVHKAMPNETIGLLAGRVMRDEHGPYTLVLSAECARHDEVEATPSHVRISAAGHAQVRSRLESSAYGLDIIGWYHSHPRFPARFSPVDKTEQSTWRDPNHLGVVISGNDMREPIGVYRGPEAALLIPAKTEKHEQKATAQPDAPVISSAVEEGKEEPIATVESAPTVVEARTKGLRSETALKLLSLMLTVAMLILAIGFNRLDSRVAAVEKRLTSAELYKERTSSAPPKTTTEPPSASLAAQGVPPNETANSRLIVGENPATKIHPLLPSKANAPPRRPKPERRLNSSEKDGAKKRAANSQSKTVKTENAPENKLKSTPDGAANKSTKP